VWQRPTSLQPLDRRLGVERFDETNCPQCGRGMRLVGSEVEKQKPGIIVHTYECECGEALVIEDPNNGRGSLR
jgi:hypothetical protein